MSRHARRVPAQTAAPAAHPVARPTTWKKKLAFSMCIWCGCILVLYGSMVVVRSYRLYWQVKIEQRGELAQIHEPDAVLGYVPIANSESVQLMRMGDPVPTKFDAHGFRVPVEAAPAPASSGPQVMAFGCSFTYGAACRAEHTYAFLVAQELGGYCHNAGVSGYGLTQMLLRARQLTPEYRPDIVLVQYSPWLIDRAVSLYAASTLGKKPVPYFFDHAGTLEIQSPVFTPYLVDPGCFQSGRVSIVDFLAFVGKVGVPLLVHDDVCGATTSLRQVAGNLPQPATDRQQVVDAVYGAFDELCQRIGATLVIVTIDQDVPAGPRESLHAAPHAVLVDAHAALVAGLPLTGTTTYQRFYLHWRGTPPVLIDHHPNPLAHSVIAAAIVKTLGERSGSVKN